MYISFKFQLQIKLIILFLQYDESNVYHRYLIKSFYFIEKKSSEHTLFFMKITNLLECI